MGVRKEEGKWGMYARPSIQVVHGAGIIKQFYFTDKQKG